MSSWWESCKNVVSSVVTETQKAYRRITLFNNITELINDNVLNKNDEEIVEKLKELKCLSAISINSPTLFEGRLTGPTLIELAIKKKQEKVVQSILQIYNDVLDPKLKQVASNFLGYQQSENKSGMRWAKTYAKFFQDAPSPKTVSRKNTQPDSNQSTTRSPQSATTRSPQSATIQSPPSRIVRPSVRLSSPLPPIPDDIRLNKIKTKDPNIKPLKQTSSIPQPSSSHHEILWGEMARKQQNRNYKLFGENCVEGDTCEPPHICRDGKCHQCNNDSHCKSNKKCVNHSCIFDNETGIFQALKNIQVQEPLQTDSLSDSWDEQQPQLQLQPQPQQRPTYHRESENISAEQFKERPRGVTLTEEDKQKLKELQRAHLKNTQESLTESLGSSWGAGYHYREPRSINLNPYERNPRKPRTLVRATGQ